MSDFTSDTPVQSTRSHKAPKTEFMVYFAVIFVATIPLATLAWLLTSLRGGKIADKGPIARAWSQARIITPMIFSA